MKDPRYDRLAETLVNHSISLKKGEHVLVEAFDIPQGMVIALMREIRRRKGHPHVQLQNGQVIREMLSGMTEEQVERLADYELSRMKRMDAYIGLRGSDNIFENAEVPGKRMRLYMGVMRKVQNWRVNRTKWVVLRWPTPAMAQQALMGTEAFEEFFFRVCGMDYGRMIPGERALKQLIDKTDRVEIKGPGTDLRFSMKGIKAIMSTGRHNIPDGEVFSSPVRDSVEGVITYNVPTVKDGLAFDNVSFEFEKGKIVKARADAHNKQLKSILDGDPGARYIGEFAIGFNPHILEPIRDTLFDEKIAGSFHFTPGQAYEGEPDNGNRSQLHWDIVCIQRPEYGGGEIWFDGKLIRKDGLFVPKSLQKLNPDYLLAD